MNELQDMAKARGASSLWGYHIPTRKNAMVADLFERHDFVKSDEALEGEGTKWTIVPDSTVMPKYLTINRIA